MIRVRATNMSMKMGQRIKELHRIANEGEEFDVSESRYNFLSGNNPFHKVYVIKVDKPATPKVEIIQDSVEENPIIINASSEGVTATVKKPRKKKKTSDE